MNNALLSGTVNSSPTPKFLKDTQIVPASFTLKLGKDKGGNDRGELRVVGYFDDVAEKIGTLTENSQILVNGCVKMQTEEREFGREKHAVVFASDIQLLAQGLLPSDEGEEDLF